VLTIDNVQIAALELSVDVERNWTALLTTVDTRKTFSVGTLTTIIQGAAELQGIITRAKKLIDNNISSWELEMLPQGFETLPTSKTYTDTQTLSILKNLCPDLTYDVPSVKSYYVHVQDTKSKQTELTKIAIGLNQKWTVLLDNVLRMYTTLDRNTLPKNLYAKSVGNVDEKVYSTNDTSKILLDFMTAPWSDDMNSYKLFLSDNEVTVRASRESTIGSLMNAISENAASGGGLYKAIFQRWDYSAQEAEVSCTEWPDKVVRAKCYGIPGVTVNAIDPGTECVLAFGWTGYGADPSKPIIIGFELKDNVSIVTVSDSSAAADFVALAEKVLTELQAIQTLINANVSVFNVHTHIAPGGSTSATATPESTMSAPGSVAATKLKAS
jgi:hypothetical protein